MNTQLSPEAELEKIEAEYLRLKPLRDMEAMIHGLQKFDWKAALSPVVTTLGFTFMLVVFSGTDHLVAFLFAIATALTWQLHFMMAGWRRFNLIVTTLRTIADQLGKVRKELA